MLPIAYSENVYARPCIYSHVRPERDNNAKIAFQVADAIAWAAYSHGYVRRLLSSVVCMYVCHVVYCG